MIFDRISLVSAYRALRFVNDNDGTVSDILFNRDAFYGTKTNLRYKTLENFVDEFVICESKYDHKGKEKKLNTVFVHMKFLK